MIIPNTVASILLFTLLAFLVRKYSPVKICPICAGVSLTWIWMLLGMGYGFLPVEQYELITAILMGGSVIGITKAIQEKIRPWATGSPRSAGAGELKDKLDNCC